MSHIIGLDLGGTNIKGGIVDSNGQVVIKDSIPTESEHGPDHVISRLALMVNQLCSKSNIKLDSVLGVGVGTPGPLDDANGLVLSAPNMAGWTNVPLREQLSKAVNNRPVVVVNDANAAAYGEYWSGAARDDSIQNMILLTLGTGIGGGVVINGRIFKGAHGAGTELGHMIVEPLGRQCGCGQRGCIETIASATGIVKSAKERLESETQSSLNKVLKKNGDITCEDIFTAASKGDPFASDIADNACEYLGLCCVNLTRIFDPQMIVFGGGVIKAGKALLDRIQHTFEKRNWTVREPFVTLSLATLGNDAGFIGAAGMAKDELSK